MSAKKSPRSAPIKRKASLSPTPEDQTRTGPRRGAQDQHGSKADRDNQSKEEDPISQVQAEYFNRLLQESLSGPLQAIAKQQQQLEQLIQAIGHSNPRADPFDESEPESGRGLFWQPAASKHSAPAQGDLISARASDSVSTCPTVFDDQFLAAPILHPEFTRLRPSDGTPVYQRTFQPTGDKFVLPALSIKEGQVPPEVHFQVANGLAQKLAATNDPRLKGHYQSLVEEWPVLHQSILYSNLQALATHQLIKSLEPVRQELSEELSCGRDLLQALEQMHTINSKLFEDQLKRVSAVKAAAVDSIQLSHKITQHFRPDMYSGIHPSVGDIIARDRESQPKSQPYTPRQAGATWGRRAAPFQPPSAGFKPRRPKSEATEGGRGPNKS